MQTSYVNDNMLPRSPQNVLKQNARTRYVSTSNMDSPCDVNPVESARWSGGSMRSKHVEKTVMDVDTPSVSAHAESKKIVKESVKEEADCEPVKDKCDEKRHTGYGRHALGLIVLFIIVLLLVFGGFFFMKPSWASCRNDQTDEDELDFWKVALYAIIITIVIVILIALIYWAISRR